MTAPGRCTMPEASCAIADGQYIAADGVVQLGIKGTQRDYTGHGSAYAQA